MAGITAKLNAAKTELTITLPFTIASKAEQSASGKSLVLASTRGNQAISLDGAVAQMGVNVYCKVDD